MAREVDRFLIWRRLVERLEADLDRTDPARQEHPRAELEWAKKSEHAAFAALVSAANRGDPEAIVALDALQNEARPAA